MKCFIFGTWYFLRATRLSNKLLEQGHVMERLRSSWRKFYGPHGDLIKQFEVSLSQMLNDILWPDHIQWQPPTDQTLYRTRPFTEFWEVSIEHLRLVWHADRGSLLLRTPGPVLLGLANILQIFYLLRPILFPDYSSNMLRYFLNFAFESCLNKVLTNKIRLTVLKTVFYLKAFYNHNIQRAYGFANKCYESSVTCTLHIATCTSIQIGHSLI